MKTEKEILNMTKEELQDYKWSVDLDQEKEDNSDCSNCLDCSYCSYCSNLIYCRNMKDKNEDYYVCNIKVTKEEFDKVKQKLEKIK